VAESTVLPWVKDEVARLRVPEAVTLAASNAAARAALSGRLERANELYIAGKIKPERYAQEEAAVADELARLGNAETLVSVPSIDWTRDPRSINVVLRAILVDVQLGPDLHPVSATWRVPEWRRP
jgi:hypothetical protein